MSMHKLALRFDWYQTCLSGPLVDLASQYANQYINTLPSKGKGVRPNERNEQIGRQPAESHPYLKFNFSESLPSLNYLIQKFDCME